MPKIHLSDTFYAQQFLFNRLHPLASGSYAFNNIMWSSCIKV